MNVQLVPYEPDLYPAYLYIKSNMRQADVGECLAFGVTPDTLPDDTLNLSDVCYLALLDGEPVFILGYITVLPGIVQLWGFGTRKTRRVLPELTHFCATVLGPELYETGARRMQVHVPLQSEHSVRWLTQHVGMRVEAVMAEYCADGSPMVQLALTRQVYEQNVLRTAHSGTTSSTAPGD